MVFQWFSIKLPEGNQFFKASPIAKAHRPQASTAVVVLRLAPHGEPAPAWCENVRENGLVNQT